MSKNADLEEEITKSMDEQLPASSVISILPYEIYESKPNLYPGNFTIPAGTILRPGILRVKFSRFYVPMAFGAPALTAHSPAYEVSNSVVNDYVDALLGVRPDCKPGIFAVHRTFKNPEEANSLLTTELHKRQLWQRNWYISLVNMADADYEKHKNAQAISDLQKLAARELNFKNKPWLMDLNQLSINNCPICYSQVNEKAIKCLGCGYILRPDEYEKIKGRFEVTVQPPK